MNRSAIQIKYNDPGSGLFKDNTTKDIAEEDVRDFVEDISNAALTIDDNAYNGVKGTSPGINTITALKAIVTTNNGVTPVGTCIAYRDTDDNVFRFYELVSGTDAESLPDVVRPTDFNASTNQKVWKTAPAGSLSADGVSVDDSLFDILSGIDVQEVFDNLDVYLSGVVNQDIDTVLAAGNSANGQNILELSGIENITNDFLLSGKYNTELYVGDGADGIFGCEFHSDQFYIASPQGALVNDINSLTYGLFFSEPDDQLQLLAGSASVYLSGDTLNLISGHPIPIGNDILVSGSVNGASGGSSYGCGGTIATSVGPVGNVGTGDDTLFTSTIQANTLNSGNKGLILSCSGTFANTINTKRLRVKFGGTTIFDSGALAITAAADWSIYCEIVRTGAATQKCITRLLTSSSVLVSTVDYATCAATLSNNNALAVTGEATANDDIVGEFFNITFRP